MYIHIGSKVLLSFKDIVAILNLQESDLPLATEEFLEIALSEKRVKGNKKHAKSCIITDKEVYYSQISTSTLLKRSDN